MSWANSDGSRAGGGATLKDTWSMSGPLWPATSLGSMFAVMSSGAIQNSGCGLDAMNTWAGAAGAVSPEGEQGHRERARQAPRRITGSGPPPPAPAACRSSCPGAAR